MLEREAQRTARFTLSLLNRMMLPTPKQIERFSQVLRRGEVAILPTDTIYGIHVDARNERAVATVIAIKGREDKKPFVVLCSGLEQAESLGAILREPVRALLARLWPERLTALVELREPIAATRGQSRIAIRVPASEWLRQLIELTGPLASTSVNESGDAPLYTIGELSRSAEIQIQNVLDLGPLEARPSTLVDFTVDPPVVLRQGDFAFTQNLWKTTRKTL